MAVRSVRYHVVSFAQITRYTNSIYAAIYTLVGAFLSGGITAVQAPSGWGAAAVVGLCLLYTSPSPRD